MWEVVPKVTHERDIQVRKEVHEVRHVEILCHFHLPEALVTLIILEVVWRIVLKDHNVEIFLRKFRRRNSGMLDYLALMEHTT